jgi:hypothetical protein
MNDKARTTLAELIAKHGKTLSDDPRKTEGLLRDLCGDQRREISVLVGAMRERVPADLQASQGGTPMPMVVGRLGKRLEDNLGLAEDAARWAVESWGLALGVLSAKDVTKRSRSQSSATGTTRPSKRTPQSTPSTSPVAPKDQSKPAVKPAAPDTFREVVTLAGTGTPGFADGPAESAQFNTPSGLARDGGDLYVADTENRRLRIIIRDRIVTTLFGTGERGVSRDGPFSSAAIANPQSIAVGKDGGIYVADHGPMAVRVVLRQLQSVRSVSNFTLAAPFGLAVGPDGAIWVTNADSKNSQVIRLELWKPSRTYGKGSAGYGDGPAGEAAFHTPAGVAVNDQGSVFIADSGNNLIRKIGRDGLVCTVAGEKWFAPFGTSHRDGPGTVARFHKPMGVAIDARGRIIVADALNHCIRRVAGDNSVTTIAGSGRKGFKGGPPLQAEFNQPLDVAVGDDGTIYVADGGNHCIRAIRP